MARGGASELGGRLSGAALQYLASVLVLRLFGPHEAGRYFLGLAIITVLASIGRLGFDVAIVRFIAEQIEHGGRSSVRYVLLVALSSVALLTVVASVVLWVVATPVGALFQADDLDRILRAFVPLLVPLALLGVAASATRAFHVQRYANFHLLLYPALVVASVLFVRATERPIDVLPRFVALAAWICLGLTLLPLRRLVGQVADKKAQRPRLAELWRVALPQSLVHMLGIVLVWTDVLMLGVFADVDSIGIYYVISRTAALATLPHAALAAMAMPRIAQLHTTGDTDGWSQVYASVTRWTLAISGTAIAFLAVGGPQILIIAGAPAHVGDIPLLALLAATLVNIGGGPSAWTMAMTGLERQLAVLTVAAVVMNLLLNVALIPVWGLVGAATATACSLIAQKVGTIVLIRWRHGAHPFNKPYFRVLLAIVLAAVVAFAVIHNTGAYGVTALLASAVLVLLVALPAIIRFGLTGSDKTSLRQLLSRTRPAAS